MKTFSTDEELKQFITGIESGKKVVLDFYAEWCMPCKKFASTFEKASNDDNFKDVEFVKVNVEDCNDIAVHYKVRNIPTIVVTNNEMNILAAKTGAISENDFRMFLTDNI